MRNWAERIKKNEADLSKTEQDLLHFIEENPEKAAFMRQSEMVSEAKISKPMIISCFRKLGYSDFKNFQEGIQDFYSGQITSLKASRVVFRETHDIPELIRNAVHVDSQALHSMETLLNPEVLEEVAGQLLASRKIFTLCSGTGSYPARYLHQRLLRYGLPSILIETSPDRIPDELSGIGQGDCFINFLYSRAVGTISPIMKYTRQKGACNILITGRIEAELSHLSDYALFIPRGQIRFKNSMAVPMWFSNLLLLTLELKAGPELQKHLEELELLRQ